VRETVAVTVLQQVPESLVPPALTVIHISSRQSIGAQLKRWTILLQQCYDHVGESDIQDLNSIRRSKLMSTQQQARKLAHAKARRAANNNYQKLLKTLYTKLEKLHTVYSADIYFIARRNGRINECASADATGRPWSPQNGTALVCFSHLSDND
jgi:hypothetical protein